ncbi:hypothetical protein L227DRAFT_612203 [Lentinus tigrinus ALCF2SS1-6]|uniref:Uncharacterized protein n=1 Tax=Lentinus tigrinus ALCF2SS1-6 TaxID=1328759 RepID=A0A5C2S7V9_9APHY|nr:hypothetical protein L227DRAFT_612203 [Lentinus tigrinus ALCF2SS1-6]
MELVSDSSANSEHAVHATGVAYPLPSEAFAILALINMYATRRGPPFTRFRFRDHDLHYPGPMSSQLYISPFDHALILTLASPGIAAAASVVKTVLQRWPRRSLSLDSRSAFRQEGADSAWDASAWGALRVVQTKLRAPSPSPSPSPSYSPE